MRRIIAACSLLTSVICFSTGAHAALISTTLGNDASGFNDGDSLPVFLVGGAQSGQAAPFDQSYGTDIGLFSGTNFSATWSFSYAPIAASILSASLTIGIYDHDTAASGSQLDSFTVDGTNLAPTLDALFEAGGGSGDSVYNVYTIDLGPALFSSLADGSAFVSLALTGPGLIYDLFGGGVVESGYNGANLIYSTLQIVTQDAPPPTPVPEPASLSLLLAGLGALAWRRRRSAVARVSALPC